jgi:hypothetical protein
MTGTLAERRNVALAERPAAAERAALAHRQPRPHRAHDGVVYLRAATQAENDLAQSLHEAFTTCRPACGRVRSRCSAISPTSALLLLDDVGLSPAAVGAINDTAPSRAGCSRRR